MQPTTASHAQARPKIQSLVVVIEVSNSGKGLVIGFWIVSSSTVESFWKEAGDSRRSAVTKFAMAASYICRQMYYRRGWREIRRLPSGPFSLGDVYSFIISERGWQMNTTLPCLFRCVLATKKSNIEALLYTPIELQLFFINARQENTIAVIR